MFSCAAAICTSTHPKLNSSCSASTSPSSPYSARKYTLHPLGLGYLVAYFKQAEGAWAWHGLVVRLTLGLRNFSTVGIRGVLRYVRHGSRVKQRLMYSVGTERHRDFRLDSRKRSDRSSNRVTAQQVHARATLTTIRIPHERSPACTGIHPTPWRPKRRRRLGT
jgi:hypothetical protein